VALVQKELVDALTTAFQKSSEIRDVAATSLLLRQDVCKLIASAYHSYAIKATPGLFVHVTAPVPDAFSTPLILPMLDGLPAAFTAYWKDVTWFAPGFIPVNPTVSAAGLTVVTGAMPTLLLKKRNTFTEFAEDLATILHAATLAVVVTSATTAVPPVVAPVPLL